MRARFLTARARALTAVQATFPGRPHSSELTAVHRRGELRFCGEYAALADPAVFAQWLAPLRACEWVVYAKRPFAGPEAVLAYPSRYTHPAAIFHQRIVSLHERRVTLRPKEHRAQGRNRFQNMS